MTEMELIKTYDPMAIIFPFPSSINYFSQYEDMYFKRKQN